MPAACSDRKEGAGSRPGDPAPRILVIGCGNAGRRDDGLGPALAVRLEALELPDVTVESDYQFMIEHAELAARHDVVVFADAATDIHDGAPFYLRSVTAALHPDCFSHRISPEAVLHLAAQCFGARPRAWLLGIRPMDLESFAEGLTPEAEQNLAAALAALREAIVAWRGDR
jgi:hydrogenase maturation protease